MFNSGKSVSELITELKEEVDVAVEIPTSTYLLWLSIIEQLCYSEFIKEQRELTISNPTLTINIKELTVSDEEEPIRFEDIYAVYADDVQLMKTTLANGRVFSDTFYKHNDDLGLNIPYQTRELKVIYIARPKVKTTEEGNVMMPIEFIDMVKAKMRGEAYKLVNEEELASKWLNDYNSMLENFKAWCDNRASRFGM